MIFMLFNRNENMRRIARIVTAFALCLACASSAEAQVIKNFYEMYQDPNDSWDTSWTYTFNRLNPTAKYASVVNGILVKSTIGLDRHYFVDPDTTDSPVRFPMWVKGVGNNNDSVYVAENPDMAEDENAYVMFGNMKCNGGVDVYRYTKENHRLVSLDELRRKCYPKLEGDVLYMINKHFIMVYADLYKVDETFINHIELINSQDIDVLKDRKPFWILRIFTKTDRNNWAEIPNGYGLDKYW